MGWDTQITIIAENCQDNCHKKIAQLIYDRDAKDYTGSGYSKMCFQTNDKQTTLFFSYERRKYLPYWVIQEISAVYKNVFFTVIASCPEFLGGPAGIVKISDGEITDSYGFTGLRKAVTESPDETVLLKWFGKNQREEIIRLNYLEEHPAFWCEENFAANLIEFRNPEIAELESINRFSKENPSNANWEQITSDF